MTKLQMAFKLKAQDMEKPKQEQQFAFGAYTIAEVYTKKDLQKLYKENIKG